MAKKETRFEIVQEEGNGLSVPVRQVLLDTATGVQYLFVQFGNAGGAVPPAGQGWQAHDLGGVRGAAPPNPPALLPEGSGKSFSLSGPAPTGREVSPGRGDLLFSREKSRQKPA